MSDEARFVFSGLAAPFLVVPGLLTCGTGPFLLNQSRAAARANRIQSFSKYNINNLFSPQLLHVASPYYLARTDDELSHYRHKRGHLASVANVLIVPLSVFRPEGLGQTQDVGDICWSDTKPPRLLSRVCLNSRLWSVCKVSATQSLFFLVQLMCFSTVEPCGWLSQVQSPARLHQNHKPVGSAASLSSLFRQMQGLWQEGPSNAKAFVNLIMRLTMHPWMEQVTGFAFVGCWDWKFDIKRAKHVYLGLLQSWDAMVSGISQHDNASVWRPRWYLLRH